VGQPDGHSQKQGTPRLLAPPPLLFFGCLIVGWVLHKLVPVSLALGSSRIRTGMGLVLATAAGVFALGGAVELLRHRTPVDPGRPTVTIVASGVFGLSRNPMYLSLLLLLAGIAVALGSLWLALSVVPLAVLLDRGVVVPEEAYLSREFGEAYVSYARRVRRWL